MNNSLSIYHVNAFANQPFKGNPAAVCILGTAKEEAWMQAVAAEMNLSETAFLLKQDDGYSLRWFTPVKEVDLCGHATLASAHILWENGEVDQSDELRFLTKSGLLSARYKDGRIELNFPASVPLPVTPPVELIDALGVSPIFCGKFGEKYLMEVATEEEVYELTPNFDLLRKLSERGISITSRSSKSDIDFISRYFAPWVGIDEDPVNGSSHCCLTPYWSEKLGKNTLKAYQASSRGGYLDVRYEGDRVFLSGFATTLTRGQVLV
jgi:PhzF family phenazine biosynthesis protein